MNNIDHAAIEVAAAVAAAAAVAFANQTGGKFDSLHCRQVSPPCTPTLTPLSATDEARYESTNYAQLIENSSETEDASGDRLAKNRERNREHARRTRLRKKEQLKKFQNRVKELEEENRKLKLSVEECDVARILLRLADSTSSKDSTGKPKVNTSGAPALCEFDAAPSAVLSNKRKRFVSNADEMEQTLENIKKMDKSPKKTQINWKSGVMHDENGEQKQLTPEELDSLRRERNRIHAKMTRDRKKMFMANIEQTIASLETENKELREKIVSKASFSCGTMPSSFMIVFPKEVGVRSS